MSAAFYTHMDRLPFVCHFFKIPALTSMAVGYSYMFQCFSGCRTLLFVCNAFLCPRQFIQDFPGAVTVLLHPPFLGIGSIIGKDLDCSSVCC